MKRTRNKRNINKNVRPILKRLKMGLTKKKKNMISSKLAERRSRENEDPCLCEVLSPLLIVTRLLGILPIIAVEKRGHISSCGFVVRKFWMVYSFSIQLIYLSYLLLMYGSMFYLGPVYRIKTEWYVMTFAHFISDAENFIMIFNGCVLSKSICTNLTRLSNMHGFVGESKILRKNLRMVLIICLGSYVCLIITHAHIAFLRKEHGLQIQLLDRPFILMVRGGAIIFGAFEVVIVFIFCFLITSKYKYLANITSRTMDHLYDQAGGESHQSLMKYTPDAVTFNLSKGVPKLQQLEKFYHLLTDAVSEVNKTVGLSILASVTSSLYTTMYYLYRFSTATEESITNNKNERFHYVVGLVCKSGKMFGYMLMGSNLLKASQEPLETLRKSRLINLPTEIQLKVQTLMLEWLGSKSYLSAGGIVRVGPWLLAPILGNVITYLLVALQFNQSNLEVITAEHNDTNNLI